MRGGARWLDNGNLPGNSADDLAYIQECRSDPRGVCGPALDLYTEATRNGRASLAAAKRLDKAASDARAAGQGAPPFFVGDPALYAPHLRDRGGFSSDKDKWRAERARCQDDACRAAVDLFASGSYEGAPKDQFEAALRGEPITTPTELAAGATTQPEPESDPPTTTSRPDDERRSGNTDPGTKPDDTANNTTGNRGNNRRDPANSRRNPGGDDPGNGSGDPGGGSGNTGGPGGGNGPGTGGPKDIGKGMGNALSKAGSGAESFKDGKEDAGAADIAPGSKPGSLGGGFKPGQNPGGQLPSGFSERREQGRGAASGPRFQVASAGPAGFPGGSVADKSKGSALPDIPSRFTRLPGEIPLPGSFGGSGANPSFGGNSGLGGSNRGSEGVVPERSQDGKDDKSAKKPGDESLSPEELKQLEEIEKLLKEAGKGGKFDLHKFDDELEKLTQLLGGSGAASSSVYAGEFKRQVAKIRSMAGRKLSAAEQEDLLRVAESLGLSRMEAQNLLRSVEDADFSAQFRGRSALSRYFFTLLKILRRGWKLTLALLVALLLSWMVLRRM